MSQHWLLTEALKAGFPSAKHLALAGGISFQTATRYRRGETYPDAITIARLMGKSRLVVEAMLRMAGLDDLSLEQEQVRLVRDLVDLERQRAARHERLAAAYAAAGVDLPPELANHIHAPGTSAEASGGQARGADRSRARTR